MYTDSTGNFAITATFLAWAAVALFGLATVGYIESQFHPIQTTLELVGQGITWLGTQVWNGLQWVFSQWEPGTWPGDDPTVAPGDDFIWRGPGDIGSDRGEWYNQSYNRRSTTSGFISQTA